MKFRQLLCENCKLKVRTLEAIYQRNRRLKIKEVGSPKNKIKKEK